MDKWINDHWHCDLFDVETLVTSQITMAACQVYGTLVVALLTLANYAYCKQQDTGGTQETSHQTNGTHPFPGEQDICHNKTSAINHVVVINYVQLYFSFLKILSPTNFSSTVFDI